MEAQEVSQLDPITPNENTLIPIFNESEGLGRTTLQNLKTTVVKESVDAEKKRAEQAESTLQNNIDNETQRVNDTFTRFYSINVYISWSI